MPVNVTKNEIEILRQKLGVAPKPAVDALTYPKCGNHWLEQIEVTKIQRFHSVAFGRKAPSTDNVSFFLMKCPLCGWKDSPEFDSGRTGKVWREWEDMAQCLKLNEETIGVNSEGFPATEYKPISPTRNK